MSAAINTGGPAFPMADPFAAKTPGTVDEAQRLAEGMSLRDYFAAKALGGMASAYHEHWTAPRLADAAYELADEMLRARAAIAKATGEAS